MNGSPPQLPAGQRFSRLTPGRVIRLALLGLVFFLVAWHLNWRISNSRAVHRLESNARAQSEPLDFGGLAAVYGEIPPEDNAYVALEAIWASEDPVYWGAFKSGARNLRSPLRDAEIKNVPLLNWDRLRLPPTNRLNPSELEVTAKFLASEREHMDHVGEALKRPDFRAPIAFADGQAALLPYLAALKHEATLFRVEAGWAGDAGQPDAAVHAIGQAARVGHCLDKDPFVIGQLVRLGILSMAIGSAERLLCQAMLNEDQLQRLARVIASLQATDGLKRALIGERAMFFGFLDSPERASRLSAEPGDGESPQTAAAKSAFGMKLMAAVGMTAAEKRLAGEAFEELLARATTLDFATNNQIDRIFDELDRHARQFPPKVFTAMMMPALRRFGERFARVEVQRRCAEVAIRVELYRLGHVGAVPQTLGDLPGALPNDPFDGQLLRFKRTPAGYIVYSIGPDHRDNGGLLDRPTKGPSPQEYDVGFRVERLEELGER